MSVSSTNLFRKAVNLEVSPKFNAYTGVRIITGIQDEDGNDIVYEAGNDSGRVLEINSEWGTQEQANNTLAQIQGKEYKPYTADGTILDPAAELNDGVTVNGVYSGICSKITRFNSLMSADISAPQDLEIDHEYQFETSQDRKYIRQLKETKSELKIQASQIAAKVSSSGGSASSFGWVLTDHDWCLYSGGNGDAETQGADGNLVMKVDSEGLWVYGNGTFTGVLQASEFRTSSGERLATASELQAIAQSSYGSYGTSGGGYTSGFVGALNNALGVGLNVSNGKSAVKMPYVYAGSGFFDHVSGQGTDNSEDCGVNAISIGCTYLYVGTQKAEWKNLQFTIPGTPTLNGTVGWQRCDVYEDDFGYYVNAPYSVYSLYQGNGTSYNVPYLGKASVIY